MSQGYELGTAETFGDALGMFDGSKRVQDSDDYSPEYLGTNIYGLHRVELDDGVHLVGTISKQAQIYDFTDDEVVYDFSDFGGTPRAGGDSYNAVCEWNGNHYFGGWVITPSPTGSSLDTTDKYSYLLETPDLETWNILLKDRSGSANDWRAEVTDLHATPEGVIMTRGDGGLGGQGVYKYDGSSLSLIRDDGATIQGGLATDTFAYGIRGSTSLHTLSLPSLTHSTVSLGTVTTRVGGSKSISNIGCIETLRSDDHIIGDKSGFFVNGGVFVPLLGSPIEGDNRAVGWRAQTEHVGGGLVVPVNYFDASGSQVSMQSYLAYIKPPSVQIIHKAGYYAGMEVMGERLYVGTASDAHQNTFHNLQNHSASLHSIPLGDLGSRDTQPPIQERIYYGTYTAGSSGVNGVIGGWPTLGYDTVRFDVQSDTAGTLYVKEWDMERDSRTIKSVSYNAGNRKTIDVSSSVTGGHVGISFSVNAALDGAAHLQ